MMTTGMVGAGGMQTLACGILGMEISLISGQGLYSEPIAWSVHLYTLPGLSGGTHSGGLREIEHVRNLGVGVSFARNSMESVTR